MKFFFNYWKYLFQETDEIGYTHLKSNSAIATCYENIDKWDSKIMSVRFGVESVTLPVLGFLGILGNFMVIAILIQLTRRKNGNHNNRKFDRILISLSIADSFLLVMYVVDALVQVDLYTEPQWYQVGDTCIRY